MSSQDDYLDELLKGMPQEESADEEFGEQGAGGLDIDAVSGMSEEEIERLLAGGTKDNGQKQPYISQKADPLQEDVLDLLDGTGDEDLSAIQDMLEKSDRNEAIGGEEDSASVQSGRDENPADRLLADIEEEAGAKEVAADAMDNKSERVLKKEKRREQKEEKKRAKQAAKAEKGGKHKAGRKNNQKEDADLPSQGQGESSAEQYDLMMDKDLLDSIVSGAGRMGRQESRAEGMPAAPAPERKDDGAGNLADLLNYARADLDSSEDSEAEWVESAASANNSDIIAVDMDEADSMLADISERPGEKGKKDGFLSKVVSFLTEEDEPEAENEDVRLSDENEEILKELDKEKPKKAPKAKKAKKKTAKKDKKAKPKKPPKPKKVKTPKEPEYYPPGKRLTFKKMLPIILFGVSLAVVIFLFVSLSTDYADKQAAREAYAAGDYDACYRNLFGKKLNDAEATMYGRSESILYIRLWFRDYEKFVEEGSEVEALDSLIQTVKDYPDLYEYAAQWNAGMDVYEVYQQILDILSNKYGITEMQALQIADIRSDLEYTRTVTALAEGKAYEPGQAQGTATLTDWYNGDDRRVLETQINQVMAETGMTYYLEIQEPGTIIYNYKYTEPLNREAIDMDELRDYYGTSLDEQYMVYVQSIQEFQDVYGIPVTTIRINYLDADGTSLFSRDYTKDYVPGEAGTQGGFSTESLPDALPEESEIEEGDFVGNE